MKLLQKVGFLLVVAVLAMGCPAGDDDDDDGGVVITNLGGLVALAAGPRQHFALATFYSDVTPAETIEFAGANDTCVQDTPAGATPTYTFIDVGADVTLTNGGTTLTLPRDTSSPPDIDYFVFDTTAAPSGTYDVSVAGEGAIPAGSIGSVTVPGNATMTSSATVTPGDPLDVTWDSAGDAGVINIFLEDSGQTVAYTCSVADDGAFTVPAEVTTAVGTGATVGIGSFTVGKFSFEGREVLSAGIGAP